MFQASYSLNSCAAAAPQAAALYAELGTLDKQHLSIALLLHDNNQLQAQLAAAEEQMQQMRISEAAAQEAWRAAEFQLTQSQVGPKHLQCEVKVAWWSSHEIKEVSLKLAGAMSKPVLACQSTLLH